MIDFLYAFFFWLIGAFLHARLYGVHVRIERSVYWSLKRGQIFVMKVNVDVEKILADVQVLKIYQPNSGIFSLSSNV